MEMTGNVMYQNNNNTVDVENLIKMFYGSVEMLFMIETFLRKAGVTEQDIINLKSFSEYVVSNFEQNEKINSKRNQLR